MSRAFSFGHLAPHKPLVACLGGSDLGVPACPPRLTHQPPSTHHFSQTVSTSLGHDLRRVWTYTGCVPSFRPLVFCTPSHPSTHTQAPHLRPRQSHQYQGHILHDHYNHHFYYAQASEPVYSCGSGCIPFQLWNSKPVLPPLPPSVQTTTHPQHVNPSRASTPLPVLSITTPPSLPPSHTPSLLLTGPVLFVPPTTIPELRPRPSHTCRSRYHHILTPPLSLPPLQSLKS